MNSEILLRPGVPIDSALDSLRRLKTDVSNVQSGGPGLGRLLTDYLSWVEDAERLLRNLISTTQVWQNLYTDRYWHLRELAAGRPLRPEPLIRDEARWQMERIEQIIDELERIRHLFGVAEDEVLVVADTNVLIHYRRYDELDWTSISGARAVRLVLPLLVIDELDEFSYKSRETAQRAREVLRSIQKLRGDSAPDLAVPVRPNVTLQIYVDPPGHVRRPNNDDEFLTRAEIVASTTSGRVIVATGDYGMRLRAISRGLSCLEIGDELRIGPARLKTDNAESEES